MSILAFGLKSLSKFKSSIAIFIFASTSDSLISCILKKFLNAPILLAFGCDLAFPLLISKANMPNASAKSLIPLFFTLTAVSEGGLMSGLMYALIVSPVLTSLIFSVILFKLFLNELSKSSRSSDVLSKYSVHLAFHFLSASGSRYLLASFKVFIESSIFSTKSK